MRMGCSSRTEVNATYGPRPDKEPVPICVNGLPLKKAKGAVATGKESGMGKGPSIVRKCWDGKVFSRTKKKRKDSLKREISGNLRCKNDLKKAWRFTG